MRPISGTPAAPQGTGRQFLVGWLRAAVKRWWTASRARRIERAAAAQLRSMSDRELKDIGLIRSGIARAVQGDTARERAFGATAETSRHGVVTVGSTPRPQRA